MRNLTVSRQTAECDVLPSPAFALLIHQFRSHGLPSHSMLLRVDLEIWLLGLVNFVFVNVIVCVHHLHRGNWRNPNTNHHQTCDQTCHQTIHAYSKAFCSVTRAFLFRNSCEFLPSCLSIYGLFLSVEA